MSSSRTIIEVLGRGTHILIRDNDGVEEEQENNCNSEGKEHEEQ